MKCHALRLLKKSNFIKTSLVGLTAAAGVMGCATAQPEASFTPLFDGKTLNGWTLVEGKGKGYGVKDGVIYCAKGGGGRLLTEREYTDFELLVDWKIPPHGDSGIYLRGSPQVQIWDPFTPAAKTNALVGSGGLFNNKVNSSQPLKVADKPIGEWNRFRIVMAGDKAHVFLNGELVVKDTALENYWDRNQPIFPSGQIELQNHGGPLWFKNICIREIAR